MIDKDYLLSYNMVNQLTTKRCLDGFKENQNKKGGHLKGGIHFLQIRTGVNDEGRKGEGV